MGKKGIEELIEDMEMFIDGCKIQPFSNNKISVPRDTMLEMIDELRMKIPGEIERCQKVMQNKDAILTDAKVRADQVVAAANAEAVRRVDNSQLVVEAQANAKQIIDEAVAAAGQIIENANQDGDTIRIGAMHYTNATLKDVGEFISRVLLEEKQKTDTIISVLNEMMGTVNANRSQIEEQLRAAENGENDRTSDSATSMSKSAPKPMQNEEVKEEAMPIQKEEPQSQELQNPIEQEAVQEESSELDDAVSDLMLDE